MFSPIFSDLNLLFPLPRSFSTTHSWPLLLRGEKRCSKFRFKLRLNIPPKDCHRNLLWWPLCAPSDGRLRTQLFPATESTSENSPLNLLFWATCSQWLAEARKFHPPLFPTLKGHPRFRAPCRCGWGLYCENVTTSAWSCFLPFLTDVDSESTPHKFPAQ